MKSILLSIAFAFTLVHATGQTTQCACCNEKAKQFHFWVGDWEAYNPAGKLAGTNRIVLMEGNCVMQENWVSAGSPFTGTSYNFLNVHTGKWEQLWLDNQGGNLRLEGEWNGVAMILKSKEVKNPSGQLQTSRITWTPNADGTVRQLWEVSQDAEKTWTVAFDGLYKKRKV
jgi:hypothetical protein